MITLTMRRTGKYPTFKIKNLKLKIKNYDYLDYEENRKYSTFKN